MAFGCVFAILSLLALAACAPTPPAPAATLPSGATEVPAPLAATPAPAVSPAQPSPTRVPAAATAAPAPAAWDDRAIYRAGLIEAEQGILDQLPYASVYHIELRLADDLTQVTGRQQVRYTNAEEAALGEVYFRLFPNFTGGAMTVTNVMADDRPAEAALAFEDTALRVPLARPLLPSQSTILSLDYVISVPATLDTGYGLLGYVDGMLTLDSPYAAIPVYDDEGWNVEIPPGLADLSYFDMSFYRVRVFAPAGLVLAASGVAVAQEVDGGTQVVTFAAGPVRDFFLAGSFDYEVISTNLGGTLINSYAPAAWAPAARRAADTVARALRHFGARFGPYPYAEMDVVSTPLLALGIEYPGITGITVHLYDPAREIQGSPSQTVIEATVAHEMAHQWFYSMVGSDQVDEPWLDEALAQYATALYFQDSYGAAAADQYRATWAGRWDRVDRAEIPIGLPAREYGATEYSAIVYGRGPLFLDALAERMGVAVFDRFLADYAAAHRWGIAGRADFQVRAEEVCGCSLADLFAAWVDRQD